MIHALCFLADPLAHPFSRPPCTPWLTALAAAALLPVDRLAGSTVPPEPCAGAGKGNMLTGWLLAGSSPLGHSSVHSSAAAASIRPAFLAGRQSSRTHLRQGPCGGGGVGSILSDS